MATEGHRQGPRGDHKKMRKEEMDKELNETREELNRLMQWKKM
jgi:ribosomal protein L29